MKEITKKIKDYLLSVGYPDKEKIFYLEVWLWLWREKGIKIELSVLSSGNVCPLNQYIPVEEYSCPEEAIIAAIDYLVNNNLIE